ncbi:phage tail protein [Marinobacter sp.]|uniref:phage tail protein n=1 Tax=Marinobacter sp. TaxID=50741 RepID=UPI003A93E69E
MPSFYTILTDVGQAKLANAIALGQTIDITDLAVGDGNGALPVPDTSRTALVNEVRRAPINLSEVDAQNPSWVVVEQVLPPDVGGWTIREIGVFDTEGDLIGYGNYPETYKPVLAEGSSRTQTIRFVMEVSDTEAVTLKVDPSVVLATRGYADNLMTTHEASRNHPSGTTVAKGMLRLATADRVKQYNAADALTAAALRDSGLLGAALTVVTSAESPKALTVAEAGLVLVDATNGAVTLNLPAASGNSALHFIIIRTDASANVVTVAADGTDTISSVASITLNGTERVSLFSDGTSTWRRAFDVSLSGDNVFNGDNEFGTMPTVGNNPVVESGSNTDGQWTRYADGTQICAVEVKSADGIVYAYGSIYSSDSVAFTWPAAFTGGLGRVAQGARTGRSNSWCGLGGNGIGDTVGTLAGYSGSSSGATPNLDAIGYGRWF